jgi:hypothetical protein
MMRDQQEAPGQRARPGSEGVEHGEQAESVASFARGQFLGQHGPGQGDLHGQEGPGAQLADPEDDDVRR